MAAFITRHSPLEIGKRGSLPLERPVPEILPTHTPSLFAIAVARAVEVLKKGGLVALPTETVYGLAANAFDPPAVARIFALKRRPSHNPIIVHVASRDMARELANPWPKLADELADRFWPGPLTVVVGRSKHIPDIVTSGGPTVGIRWPIHPLMQAVIQTAGFPLAAPSANLANQISPTCATHVAEQFGDELSLIIDGGDCNVGIESTVVDVTGTHARVLRPGMISSAALSLFKSITQEPREFNPAFPVIPTGTVETFPRSPGMQARHYAPKGRLVIWKWEHEADLHRRMVGEGIDPDTVAILAFDRIPLSGRFNQVHVIPDDPEAYARALYGQLHACDAHGNTCIIVEEPPVSGEWEGIRDRLRRASTPTEEVHIR